MKDLEKKQVVSFATDRKVVQELKRHKKFTTFIHAIVSVGLGLCPLCNGPWPRTSDDEEGEGKEEASIKAKEATT